MDIISNPFDGETQFDICVVDKINAELYAASAALTQKPKGSKFLNSNGAISNGANSSGANSNGANSNGANTNGANSRGTAKLDRCGVDIVDTELYASSAALTPKTKGSKFPNFHGAQSNETNICVVDMKFLKSNGANSRGAGTFSSQQSSAFMY